jgi:hypothetical protein
MEKVTRNIVINSLENGWDEYIDQLIRLSPIEKEAFLQKQGFRTIADLLAHIVGWWKECMRNITIVQEEPDYKSPLEINVDEYNEKVIEANRNNSDEETIRLFENTKSELKVMLKELPDSVIENEAINDYLYWCITNHIAEHKIL